MRALVYYGDQGGLKWETRQDLEPRGDDVIVSVMASGICGTDAQFLRGRLTPWQMPIVLGHEIAGIVDAVGSNVRDFRTGDRVASHYHDPCGKCPPCRHGGASLCDAPRFFMGFSDDGGFATITRVPSSCLVRLPSRLSFQDGASLVCSATTAYHALDSVGAVSGTALVIGCGAVGLHCIRLLTLSGLAVACASRSSAKRELGITAGAASAFSPEDQCAERFDVTVDTVCSSESFGLAVEMTAKLGKTVLLGFSDRHIPLDVTSAITKGLRVITSCGATRSDLQCVIKMAEDGLLSSFVVRSEKMSDLKRLIDTVKAGKYAGKIVAVMDS